MAAFRRPNSRYYRIRLNRLPGYGKLGQISTRVLSKKIADQMQALVRRIAEWGLTDTSWHKVLDAIKGGELELPELLKASNEGRLEHLKHMVQDPPLKDAIEEYRRTGVDYQTDNGLRLLEDIAAREYGSKPRLGELRSGKAITLLCARAEQEGGRKTKQHPAGSPLSRNYVVRSLKNATSKLLQFHLGNGSRDAIFADVSYGMVDDTRDLWLNGEQLAHLLAACPEWFRPFIMVAVATGADRAPLLRLQVQDVQPYFRRDLGLRVANLHLKDYKNDARSRSVAVVGPVADALAPLLHGKAPDAPVFEAQWDETAGRRLALTPDRVRRAFEEARDKAGFTAAKGFASDLRFKDLRHTAGVAFEQSGMNLTKTSAALGHKRRETSLKYTKRDEVLTPDDAVQVARQLGFLESAERRAKEG